MTARGLPLFLVSVFAALASLVALVYLAGFLQNRYAFSTIDSGVQIPTGEAARVNIALLLLFALQHSGMARRAFKRHLPASFQRPAYLLATAAVFALLFVRWEPMPNPVWFTQTRWPFQIVAAAGAVLVVWSALCQGVLYFFGLTQTWASLRGRPLPPAQFQVRGPYRWHRHPLMIGTLLFLWASNDMTQGHLLFVIFMTIYVLVAVRWEERDLERDFGAAYADYRRRVRGLI